MLHLLYRPKVEIANIKLSRCVVFNDLNACALAPRKIKPRTIKRHHKKAAGSRRMQFAMVIRNGEWTRVEMWRRLWRWWWWWCQRWWPLSRGHRSDRQFRALWYRANTPFEPAAEQIEIIINESGSARGAQINYLIWAAAFCVCHALGCMIRVMINLSLCLLEQRLKSGRLA